MNYYGYELIRESDLTHHGIKGQKWGQRRFQNEDGTWTAAGKKRYGDMEGSAGGAVRRALAKVYGVNEKFYAKRGNETMASMNKAAKEEQLRKAAAADQKKKENGPSFADKAAARALTSSNRAVERMGGRKMNATQEEKIARGERLSKKGRTETGAIGRAVGRQMAIRGATVAAGMGLAAVSMAVAMKSPKAAAGLTYYGGSALKAAMVATTAASVIRTYQDIHDIRSYNRSKKN